RTPPVERGMTDTGLTRFLGYGVLFVVTAAACRSPQVSARSPGGGGPAVVTAPRAVAVPEESSARGLESRVTKVTVYSDRARVTREATAAVGAEPVVLGFRQLPGWVDDGSVQVTASAGRILDVRV